MPYWSLYSISGQQKKQTGSYSPSVFWARRDSNPRPKDYESSALPLRHRPVTTFYSVVFCLRLAIALTSHLSYNGSARKPARLARRKPAPFPRLHLARFSRSACLTARRVPAPYLSSNLTFSQLLVGRVPQARDDFVYTT